MNSPSARLPKSAQAEGGPGQTRAAFLLARTRGGAQPDVAPGERRVILEHAGVAPRVDVEQIVVRGSDSVSSGLAANGCQSSDALTIV